MKKQEEKYNKLIRKSKLRCDAHRALWEAETSDSFCFSVVKATYTYSVLHPKMSKMKGIHVSEEKALLHLTCSILTDCPVTHIDMDDITVSDGVHFKCRDKDDYMDIGRKVYGLQESKYWFDYPIEFGDWVDSNETYVKYEKWHEAVVVTYRKNQDVVKNDT